MRDRVFNIAARTAITGILLEFIFLGAFAVAPDSGFALVAALVAAVIIVLAGVIAIWTN